MTQTRSANTQPKVKHGKKDNLGNGLRYITLEMQVLHGQKTTNNGIKQQQPLLLIAIIY